MAIGSREFISTPSDITELVLTAVENWEVLTMVLVIELLNLRNPFFGINCSPLRRPLPRAATNRLGAAKIGIIGMHRKDDQDLD
jgi:hypothetical protein